MSSTVTAATAQDSNWKAKEQAEEARFVHQKEQAQIEAIRQGLVEKETSQTSSDLGQGIYPMDRDIEGGFGGQEDLEDRYATTSGEH